MRQEFIFYKRAYDDVSQNALWQYMLEYFVKRYELIAKEKLNVVFQPRAVSKDYIVTDNEE